MPFVVRGSSGAYAHVLKCFGMGKKEKHVCVCVSVGGKNVSCRWRLPFANVRIFPLLGKKKKSCRRRVYMVQVPGSYLDSRYGVDPGSSILPSPGQSPFPASANPFSRGTSRTGAAAAATNAERNSKHKKPPSGSVLHLLPDDLLEAPEPARALLPEEPPEPSHPLLEGLPDDLMTDLYKQQVSGDAGTSPSAAQLAEVGPRGSIFHVVVGDVVHEESGG